MTSNPDWRQSPRKRAEVAAIATLGYPVVRALTSTWTWKVSGAEHVEAITKSGHHPILALWHGRILHAASGEHGFGYDPLFWVPERNVSSAELSPADKNQISHRARAMDLLRQRLGLK